MASPTLPSNTENLNFGHQMMWYCIRYLQWEVLWYCSSLIVFFSQLIFFLNASTHKVEICDGFSLLDRIDSSKVFKFAFPFRADRNIDLYLIAFRTCHYYFPPRFEWYAESSVFYWSLWWLLFSVYVCIAYSPFFLSGLIIHIEYLIILVYFKEKKLLSSHTQAWGFFAAYI